jgi:hypothetical protein
MIKIGDSQMLIFSTCKQFEPPYDIIQRNAIGSWYFTGASVMLFGIEIEGAFPDWEPVERNAWNTPLIGSMISAAEETGKRPLCFVNADIVLPPAFPKIVSEIVGGFDKYLLIGQRTNIAPLPELDFGSGGWLKIVNSAVRAGKLEPPCGIDYWVFSPGLWQNMPPIAIGRFGWDQALVYAALKADVPVIDATERIVVAHQSHPVDVQRNDEECALNIEMCKEWLPGWDAWQGWVSHAQWKVRLEGGLERR